MAPLIATIAGADLGFHTDADFIKGNIVKEMDDKKQLDFASVWLIVFFIVISIAGAQSANLPRS